MENNSLKDVLVVDDDPSIRNLIYSSLTRKGLTCDTAEDGIHALDRLSDRKYDIVLLDLTMPRLDGPGLLQEIKASELPVSERPLVLVMTASTERDTLEPVGDMVQVVIRKPFDLHSLCQLVLDCISAKRNGGEESGMEMAY